MYREISYGIKTKTLAAYILAIGLLGGAGFYGYKYYEKEKVRQAELQAELEEIKNLDKAVDILKQSMSQFRSTEHILESTPRIQVSPLVNKLQELKDSVAYLSVPKSIDFIKNDLILIMETDIDHYLAFMRDSEYMQMATKKDSDFYSTLFSKDVSSFSSERSKIDAGTGYKSEDFHRFEAALTVLATDSIIARTSYLVKPR